MAGPERPGHEPASAPYLEIRALDKMFGPFQALRDIHLDVHLGELVSFLGPSGCGKTTLLRAIAGLDVQTSGTILQGSRDISSLPVDQRDFGIVFQSYALFPNLSVRDNVGYGLVSARWKRRDIEARVAELLTLVGLGDQAAKYPAQLSGGQQQRVALARALALSPGLLLLDEPLSALDARVRARLRGELRDLQKRLGVTTIMVTHDQEEALTMSDRIVVMNAGRIEQVGSPTEIYARPATPFVADFVGRMNFMQGKLSPCGRVDVGGLPLSLGEAVTIAPGSSVTVCVRPEDVRLRDSQPGAPNTLAVRIGRMEFMGNHVSATLDVPDRGLALIADLSINDIRELSLAPDTALLVTLPPDRLRVFPDQALA